MRILLAAPILLLAFTAPALADSVTGTILAFDRNARVIVLDDRSVWQLGKTEAVAEDLQAGDRVRIDYRSDGDNGAAEIRSVNRAEG